jgi:hypothetical protein
LFETLHALLITLAISLPIACELLWLRSRARDRPNAPATDVITRQQIEILRELGSRPMPADATVYDALWAVAGLGGHQKRNGEPGWLVLYRGMQALLSRRNLPRAARASEISFAFVTTLASGCRAAARIAEAHVSSVATAGALEVGDNQRIFWVSTRSAEAARSGRHCRGRASMLLTAMKVSRT